MKLDFRYRKWVGVTCVLLTCMCSAFADNALQSKMPTPEDVLSLLNEMEQRFSSLQSFRYQVDCLSQGEKQTISERWAMAYRSPDCIRVDYQRPVQRLITLDSMEMWEYIPQAQGARRTDLKKLSSSEAQARLRQVMSRVEVDGLHPGVITLKAKEFKEVTHPDGNPGIWRIEGGNPRICFEVDPEKKVIVKTEIYTPKGELALRTDTSDFAEVMSEFWLPRRIRCVYGSGNVYVSRDFTLSDMQVNIPLEDSLFQFTPPSRVKVEGDVPKKSK